MQDNSEPTIAFAIAIPATSSCFLQWSGAIPSSAAPLLPAPANVSAQQQMESSIAPAQKPMKRFFSPSSACLGSGNTCFTISGEASSAR